MEALMVKAVTGFGSQQRDAFDSVAIRCAELCPLPQQASATPSCSAFHNDPRAVPVWHDAGSLKAGPLDIEPGWYGLAINTTTHYFTPGRDMPILIQHAPIMAIRGC